MNPLITVHHRQRIKTEEKAKVVAAVGRQNLFIPCHASCFALGQFELKDELHQDDLKEKDEFIL